MNTLTVILIIMRVYPKLGDYLKDRNLKTSGIMEIYKLNDKSPHVRIFVPI